MTTVPWQGHSPSRKARLLVWLLLLLPIVVAVVYPIAQNYLRAASLLERISDPHAAGWIANYDVHPVDVHDTTFDFRGQAIPGPGLLAARCRRSRRESLSSTACTNSASTSHDW